MPRARTALVLASLLLTTACATSPDTIIGGGDDQLRVRPEWQVGDQWTFAWREGTSHGQFTSRVIEATDTGYTLRYDTAFLWYLTPDWELISVTEDHRVVAEFSPPLPMLRFPLRAGMSWKQGAGLAASGSS